MSTIIWWLMSSQKQNLHFSCLSSDLSKICVYVGKNCHQVTTETEELLLQPALCFLGQLPPQRPAAASSSALMSEGRFSVEVVQRNRVGFLIAPPPRALGRVAASRPISLAQVTSWAEVKSQSRTWRG